MMLLLLLGTVLIGTIALGYLASCVLVLLADHGAQRQPPAMRDGFRRGLRAGQLRMGRWVLALVVAWVVVLVVA